MGIDKIGSRQNENVIHSRNCGHNCIINRFQEWIWVGGGGFREAPATPSLEFGRVAQPDFFFAANDSKQH